VAYETNDRTTSPPPAPVHTAIPLASRVDRLLATIVDGAIGLALAIPVAIWTGEFAALIHAQAVPWTVNLVNVLAGWAWFFLVNSYLLKSYGQTVGKHCLGIRISDFRSDAVPPFWRLLVRIAVPSLFGLFAPIGGIFALADDLLIYRKDRRCIHDWIASTRVVNS
jgi:uncharacterized RDD family membrane protein YckC